MTFVLLSGVGLSGVGRRCQQRLPEDLFVLYTRTLMAWITGPVTCLKPLINF
jgi:hypothetical protein